MKWAWKHCPFTNLFSGTTLEGSRESWSWKGLKPTNWRPGPSLPLSSGILGNSPSTFAFISPPHRWRSSPPSQGNHAACKQHQAEWCRWKMAKCRRLDMIQPNQRPVFILTALRGGIIIKHFIDNATEAQLYKDCYTWAQLQSPCFLQLLFWVLK